jgi:hypothetical protein
MEPRNARRAAGDRLACQTMTPRSRAAGQPVAARAARWGRGFAAVMVAASLLASGCGQSAKSGQHSGQPTSTASGAASGSVPDGTQLASLLSPARLPAGWDLTTGGVPQENSGPYLHAVLGLKYLVHNCNVMTFAASAYGFINWWSVSSASLDIEAPASANVPIVNVIVGAYQPSSDAARTLQMATSLAASCKSFTDVTGNSTTVSAQTVPGIGSQSLYLTSTAQTSAGTEVGQVLLAVTGRYVVGVDTSSASSGPVSQATMEQFGTWLVNLVNSAG